MSITNVLDGREIPVEERLPQILGALEGLRPGENLVLIAPHDPERLLRKLLVAMPGHLMWAPLEQGPTAWRWHFTARDSAKPRTVSEYLCWDHRRMEELLTDAMGLARHGDWEGARTRTHEYAVGLRRHADIEDITLFPAYLEATNDLQPIELMLSEHHDVRFGIDALERAVRARDLDSAEDALARLLEVTEQHHAKEEELLFPGMDDALDPDQRTKLVERLLVG